MEHLPTRTFRFAGALVTAYLDPQTNSSVIISGVTGLCIVGAAHNGDILSHSDSCFRCENLGFAVAMHTRLRLGAVALVMLVVFLLGGSHLCSVATEPGSGPLSHDMLGCTEFWLNRYQTLASALAAIAAAWYAGSLVKKQISLTDEQILIARAANISEFRAYIKLEIKSISVKPGERVLLGVDAINYGRTPAYEYRARRQFAFAYPGWEWETPTVVQVEGEPITTVVHPGTEGIEVEGHTTKIIIDQEMYAQVRVGSSVIKARILAEYKDAFGYDRQTQIDLDISGEYCVENQRPRFNPGGCFAT